MKKNIAIVMGGDSAERGVSIKSASVVARYLDASLYHPYCIDIDGANWTYATNGQTYAINKNDFTLLIDDKVIAFDLVFVAIHGTPGEDGKFQAYLDMLSIPYTTSPYFNCALSFNKAMTNTYLRTLGISCGKAVYLTPEEQMDTNSILEHVGLPCFVKPNEAGSSFGVSKVNQESELQAAIQHAFEHDNKVIVEEFLDGREVTCGVFDFHGKIQALPITEIVSENDFFDYAAKYEGKSQEITPARISPEEAKAVSVEAIKVYKALQLRGVARVDFILRDGIPHVIEPNTVPGISEESIIPQQAISAGYTLDEFFNAWVKRFLDS